MNDIFQLLIVKIIAIPIKVVFKVTAIHNVVVT